MTTQRVKRPLRPAPNVSARMRSVRVRDTEPELAVRRLLHSLGVRFRVHGARLPGRPDITNSRKRWCIFVHGCFWHGHDCQRGRPPKTNVEFWGPKIALNRARDARVADALQATGFRVIVVWQCELDHPDSLRGTLSSFVTSATKERPT